MGNLTLRHEKLVWGFVVYVYLCSASGFCVEKGVFYA